MSCNFDSSEKSFFVYVPSSEDRKIRELLEEAKVIAIVGLSPKEDRPSNIVARYLKEVGYRVIPVNPGYDQILGEKSYKNLLEIPFPVDIVDIFRKSSEV
ncbi:MAG: CoA-binding protein, partial [Brevinematia bacterium]